MPRWFSATICIAMSIVAWHALWIFKIIASTWVKISRFGHAAYSSIRKMLDSNLAVDESKLEYMARMPRGRDLLMNLVQKNHEVVVSDIEDRFGIKEMLTDQSKDNTFPASFLYYFGVLTLAGDTEDLKVRLKIPNLVMKSLYVDRIQKMLPTDPGDRVDGADDAEICSGGTEI